MSDSIKAGTTNITTYFQLRNVADGTDATGKTITAFDLQYVRSGATPVAKVDAIALAAANSAHADNKMIEVDATDQPALYRVDWPDAAFVSGVREVVLTVKHADIQTASLRMLIDPPANMTQIAGDTPNADDLGTAIDNDSKLVKSNLIEINDNAPDAVSFGAAIDNANNLIKSDILRISGDASAADNLEKLVDGTGLDLSNSAIDWDRVYYQQSSGNSGVTFPNGTARKPVDDIDDAVSIANTEKFGTVEINKGSTFSDAASDKTFIGRGGHINTSADLGGQAITSCRFESLRMEGSTAGVENVYDKCLMNGGSSADLGDDSTIIDCLFPLNWDVRSGHINIRPTFQTGITIDCTNLGTGTAEIYNGKGIVNIDNLTTAGTLNIFGFEGRISIGGVMSGGTINIFGGEKVEVLGGGNGVTINFISTGEVFHKTSIKTLASQTSFTLEEGSSDDDTYNGARAIITDNFTGTKKAIGLILDYTGSTKTVTLATDPGIFTMSVGMGIEILVTPKQLDDLATILTDTNQIQGKLPDNNIMGSSVKTDKDDEIDAIKTSTDAILVDTGTTLDTKLNDLQTDSTAILADTNEMQGKLPTNNIMGSSVKTDKDDEIDAIKTSTDSILVDTAEIGTAGAGLTDLGGMSSGMKTEVKAEANTALTDNNLDHLLKIAAVAGDAVDSSIIARIASKSATPSFASFDNTTDSLEAISDGESATPLTSQQVRDAMKLTPTAGAPSAGSVDEHLDDILTDTGTTLDTKLNDLQTDSTAILADTNETQGKLPTNNIMGSAVKTDKDDEIDAIKAKTDNLPTDPASETNVNENETKIDAVKVDTAATLIDTAEIGTAGVGLTDLGGMSTGMKAEVNAEVLDVSNVDTIPELPAATLLPKNPTERQAKMAVYMALRNESTTSNNLFKIKNDAGAGVANQTIADDGSTLTRSKVVAGT